MNRPIDLYATAQLEADRAKVAALLASIVRAELDSIAQACDSERDQWPPLKFWALWLGVGLPFSLACSYGVWKFAAWLLPVVWGAL
ncbi:MAG TPA: hypothetical protein VMV87_18715 [Burkholderiales bacterium]|nr:hypothetical protein [Burkholderiales bacterium]